MYIAANRLGTMCFELNLLTWPPRRLGRGSIAVREEVKSWRVFGEEDKGSSQERLSQAQGTVFKASPQKVVVQTPRLRVSIGRKGRRTRVWRLKKYF